MTRDTSLDRRARESLLSWSDQNLRDFPWRESDRSFYEVFVAEFFLTQTPAGNAADVYPEFLSEYPDLDAISSASEEELREVIRPLGFQRMRAEALSEIAEEWDELPRDAETLQSLPRVGTYVTHATRCFALSEPEPIVDRNVVRVYDRLFGDEFPDSPAERREFADEVLPSDGRRARTFNLGLLDLAALVCTSDDPDCASCPLRTECSYADERAGVEQ